MRAAFDNAQAATDPFPHFFVSNMLDGSAANLVLGWLQNRAPWQLQATDFYEQYEFSLLVQPLEAAVEFLTERSFLASIMEALESLLGARGLTLVDIVAHRLTRGQTIRIHNDFIGNAETHRLVLQLNDPWDERNGGLLMLFAGDDPESLRSVVLPLHASAFGFEISPRSNHAVSTIHAGERYSIVYTFRAVSE